MISYFKELLKTLKEIRDTGERIEGHLKSIIITNPRNHGNKYYVSTGHWNEP